MCLCLYTRSYFIAALTVRVTIATLKIRLTSKKAPKCMHITHTLFTYACT